MPTKIFLSWCHEDRGLKDRLVGPLIGHLKILCHHEVNWWEDSHINIGEQWRREILARLAECDYVLQLISPAFLASSFIRDHEVPPTAGDAPVKAALPVMLVHVPLDGTRDFRGIDRMQIFRSVSTREPRAYNQLDTRTREQFACDLASEINRRFSGSTGWRTGR